MAAMGWAIAIPLLLFSTRRLILLFASLLPRKQPTARRNCRLSILIAARNEENQLPRLLASLDRLDYPPELLDVVIVSDGSTDATAKIAARWANRHDRAVIIARTSSHGKAAALQLAFERSPSSQVYVVLDADTSPLPQSVALLLGALDDPLVGAACAYPDPGTAQLTIVARYAAVERWVSHLVTLAGKDKLRAQPSVIGAFFCVRRKALVEVGGFTASSVAEDIEFSQRLTAQGWKSRWIGEAHAIEHVPEDLPTFLAQRRRWSRGLLATGNSVRTVEDAFVAAGYLDRVFLLAAVVAVSFRIMPWSVLILYLCGPALMILTALFRAGAPSKWKFLGAVFVMAVIDLFVSCGSLVGHIRGSTVRWSAR